VVQSYGCSVQGGVKSGWRGTVGTVLGDCENAESVSLVWERDV